MQNKQVFVIEVTTGDEKLRDENGYRKDTLPMVNALIEKGIDAKVVFYDESKADDLFNEISTAAAVISRVNPGNIPGGETNYFAFLNKLETAGVKVFASPTVMLRFGAKDAVAKLAGTSIVPADTYAYYTLTDLQEKFPVALATGPRVLKQNRGSQGSGIWLVKVADESKDQPINDETSIECTEMSDNHVEHRKLGEFMQFCEQYLVGDNGQLVDMPFLPRIVEGEIRIFLIGEKPAFIVHKKPAEGQVSATLGSGAEYKYQTEAEWPELMDAFRVGLETAKEKLGGINSPLIWTADFILGPKDANGNDTYILGEFNASCVGFTSQLDLGIQNMVADEVIRRIAA